MAGVAAEVLSPGSPAWPAHVASIAGQLKHLLELGPQARAELNAHGVDAVRADFHSPLPTVREIETSFEYRSGPPPYAESGLFDADRLREFLLELMPYAAEFDPPRERQREEEGRFFWSNPFFAYSDALAHYCLVRHLKPARIVEVGSGFSTLVASAAMERSGAGSIVCIDPCPRPFLRQVPRVEQVMASPVQEVPVSFFVNSLADGDFLFIDSTHTVKAGSDCVYLYLKVLPAVRARVMVHVHDVFLPEAYPREWLLDRQYYWTEQYLVHALLAGNQRYQVCFGSHYHLLNNTELLYRFMGGKAGCGGGSLWFRSI